MKVHGKNILYFPFADVGEFQKRPRLCGIPFLAPWADLLSEQAFWANGKKYTFNMELGNVRGNMPSHGLLVTSPLWKVTRVAADAQSAYVTSRLEFWKYPDLAAQWPFAHDYEMTYSLANGELEVKTTIANLSTEAMPVAIGYHSFFQIPGHPARRLGGAFPRSHPRDSRASTIFRPARCGRSMFPIRCRFAGAPWMTGSPTWSATGMDARTSGSNRAGRRWKRCLDRNIRWPPSGCRTVPAGSRGNSSASSR